MISYIKLYALIALLIKINKNINMFVFACKILLYVQETRCLTFDLLFMFSKGIQF